jgi:hypothetical protein
MFHANDQVLILACDDDPQAAGRTGRIIDDLEPGEYPSHLTDHRWTVGGLGLLTGQRLCHTHELRKTDAPV